MAELKLGTVLEALDSDDLRSALAPFFGPDAKPKLESTRLQAPVCFWAVFHDGERRATLKAFFADEQFERYRGQLEQYYPDRLDQPDHPRGGLALVPELNGVIWAFPFDPAIPELHRCVDGAWIAEALRRRDRRPVVPHPVKYVPEVGALLAYRDPDDRKTIAFGKATPHETCGLLYLVMDRLWRSEARRAGVLRVPKPLAIRPEADLLLQTRILGRRIGSNRNRVVFKNLVEQAGPAIAAVHSTDIPFGPERRIGNLIARLAEGLPEVALTAPRLHGSLQALVDRIRLRAERSTEQPLVPSHGDFKHDQFLRYRRQFVLIDFELFCRAEPMLDIGTFCAYLPPHTPNDWRDSAAAEHLRAVFLRTYERAIGARLDYERLALYEAGMLGIRGLAHVLRHEAGWALRASQLFDLGMERLVDPNPSRYEKIA